MAFLLNFIIAAAMFFSDASMGMPLKIMASLRPPSASIIHKMKEVGIQCPIYVSPFIPRNNAIGTPMGIILNDRLEQDMAPSELLFLLGHEYSHVRHLDGLEKPLIGSTIYKVNHLYFKVWNDKKIEQRADKDAYRLLLSYNKPVNPHKLFSSMNGTNLGPGDTHYNGKTRIQYLLSYTGNSPAIGAYAFIGGSVSKYLKQ